MIYLRRFIMLALLIGAFYVVISIPKFVIIRRVECESQYGPCSINITKGLDSFKDLSFKGAKRKILFELSQNLFISDYSVRYAFPDTIKIYVVEDRPRYALKDSESSDFALVDQKGLVLTHSKETNLPQVASFGTPAIGSRVTQEQLLALNIVYDVYYLYKIKDASIQENEFVVELDGGPKIIFPLDGDRETLVGTLNFLLTNIGRVEKDSKSHSLISEIDLRFRNPVLR